MTWFPEPEPVIEGMSRKEALRHLTDSIVLENLLDEIGEARNAPTAQARHEALQQIKNKAIERDQAHTLSIRAKYMFLWVMAYCHSLLMEYEDAIEKHEALNIHISQYPMACPDPDFAMSKSLRLMSQIEWRAKQVDRSKATSETLKQLKVSSLRAEHEKLFQRFPFLIGIALEKGDREAGIKACQEFLQLIEKRNSTMPSTWITENLYLCAYFYLAIGRLDALGPIFGQFNRMERADFKPRYFVMGKLLKIIHEIEEGNWSKALALCNGWRSSKSPQELPGLAMILDFLQATSKAKSTDTQVIGSDGQVIDKASLQTSLMGLEILNLFEIPLWLQARSQGCPMIELFNQRAKRDGLI